MGDGVSKTGFYQQICAKECRNTHHKLVMNSLQHLKGPDAEAWRSIYVRYFEEYLQGSKDPDTKFKDFRNHVLHVSDNYWGGPVKQANKWYAATVEHLRNKRWKSAVYASGVLSHYYMDPLMPLHTGQTEEEGVIHRACEWSVNKSFDSLIQQLEAGSGYPDVELPTGEDWLKQAIHQGATLAHEYYPDFIDHYNIRLGSKDPVAGLDNHLREITSLLLGQASVGFARILERAFAEASAKPVSHSAWWQRYFYLLTTPVSWFYSIYRHLSGKSSVKKIAAEFEKQGKVIAALPTDEKQVRTQHAAEVLDIDLAELDAQTIRAVGTKHTPPAPLKSARPEKKKDRKRTAKQLAFRLSLSDPLERAPSIGEKTAQRFEAINIFTVDDFLSADPVQTAAALDARHINENTIRLWQTQATLACRIPSIYGHDAQIMSICGFESPEEVASSNPETLLSLIDDFVKTQEAKFILRSSKPPNREEVTNWINWSRQSRSLKKAS